MLSGAAKLQPNISSSWGVAWLFASFGNTTGFHAIAAELNWFRFSVNAERDTVATSL